MTPFAILALVASFVEVLTLIILNHFRLSAGIELSRRLNFQTVNKSLSEDLARIRTDNATLRQSLAQATSDEIEDEVEEEDPKPRPRKRVKSEVPPQGVSFYDRLLEDDLLAPGEPVPPMDTSKRRRVKKS